MNLITPTELARLIESETGEPFTRQAVHKAIAEGIIPYTLQDKKKLVDLDNQYVQGYIRDNNRQREQVKKNDIQTVDDLKNIIVPEERDAIDKVLKEMPGLEKALIQSANKILSEKKNQKQAKPKTPSKLLDELGGNIDDLSDFDIKQRIKKAELRKKELQVLILEKKYLPTDFIEDVYITYLERFNTTIERLAGTFIKDIGKDILDRGEVQPKHIEAFTTKILEVIHNNKKSVHREKIKYEPRSN